MPSTEITVEQYRALLTGLPKYWPNRPLLIAGKTFTVTEIVSLITALLDAFAATDAARADWKTAIATEKGLLEQNGPVITEVRSQAASMFKSVNATLVALDIQPRKAPKPRTGEANVAAQAKAKATREARGTRSKKEKAKVTGNVTGVVITPVVDGSTPPATPSVTTSQSSPAPATVATGMASGVVTAATTHS